MDKNILKKKTTGRRLVLNEGSSYKRAQGRVPEAGSPVSFSAASMRGRYFLMSSGRQGFPMELRRPFQAEKGSNSKCRKDGHSQDLREERLER